MSHESHVARQLLATLDQGRRFLEGVDDELYNKSPAPIAASTIGAHFRHVLDGLACFCDGLAEGVVDYDRRERDPAVETEPGAALARLRALARRVQALQEDEARPLRTRSDVPAGVDERASWRDSTVGRELQFGLSHTIHHFALIGMIVRFLGGEPPADFGVAPSTLRYWEENEACAPQAG